MTRTHQNGVDRDMTPNEETQYLHNVALMKAEEEQRNAVAETKNEARNAVLAKLGLTADEIIALLG